MTNTAKNDIKGLYIMIFAPEKWEKEQLREITRIADGMLRAKDSNFKQLMEEKLAPTTLVNITSVPYSPLMHTPQSMQTTLMGWLQKEHDVTFMPIVGENFFPHGMKSPEGKETYILHYFDIKESKTSETTHQASAGSGSEKNDQKISGKTNRSKRIMIGSIIGTGLLCICSLFIFLPVILSIGK